MQSTVRTPPVVPPLPAASAVHKQIIPTPPSQQTPGAQKRIDQSKKKPTPQRTPQAESTVRTPQVALPAPFDAVHKQLFKAFLDKKNMNANKLLLAVEKALEKFPIKHLKRRRRKKKGEHALHKLNPKVFGRSKGDRGANRIAIHVPLEVRLDPVTGKLRRRYLYYSTKAGDTITKEFLAFFTDYVHKATDHLTNEKLAEWIYSEWPFGGQHPEMEYIARLFETRQNSAPAESVTEVESAPTQIVTNGPEVTEVSNELVCL